METKMSWQGIGVSSNPYQRDEPLSLELMNHLEESAKSAEEHMIIVADSMQVENYMTMHGLTRERAEKVARSKGKRKIRGLERILKSRGIENVRVVSFDKAYGEKQKEVTQRVRQAFEDDDEIREAIMVCVPKRLRDKAEDLEKIAQYAITEIGLILSLEGTKFGHAKEKTYDAAAAMINEKLGIGNKPEFAYSPQKLEFVDDINTRVEPYSTVESTNRLLLTDSQREFSDKLARVSKKGRNKIEEQITRAGKANDEPVEAFYKRVIRPVRNSLNKTKRITGMAAALALSVLGIGSGATYVNQDIQNIRQQELRKMTPFALNGDMNTFNTAMNDVVEKTNKRIKNKYGISEYFSKQVFKNGQL